MTEIVPAELKSTISFHRIIMQLEHSLPPDRGVVIAVYNGRVSWLVQYPYAAPTGVASFEDSHFWFTRLNGCIHSLTVGWSAFVEKISDGVTKFYWFENAEKALLAAAEKGWKIL